MIFKKLLLIFISDSSIVIMLLKILDLLVIYTSEVE